MPTYTKTDLVEYFRSDAMPHIWDQERGRTDKKYRREMWEETIEVAVEANVVAPTARGWSPPKWINTLRPSQGTERVNPKRPTKWKRADPRDDLGWDFSLDDDYQRLRKMASYWNLKTSGTKEAILKRLVAHQKRQKRKNPGDGLPPRPGKNQMEKILENAWTGVYGDYGKEEGDDGYWRELQSLARRYKVSRSGASRPSDKSEALLESRLLSFGRKNDKLRELTRGGPTAAQREGFKRKLALARKRNNPGRGKYAWKSIRAGDYAGGESAAALVKSMTANIRRAKTPDEIGHASEQVQYAERASAITPKQAARMYEAVGVRGRKNPDDKKHPRTGAVPPHYAHDKRYWLRKGDKVRARAGFPGWTDRRYGRIGVVERTRHDGGRQLVTVVFIERGKESAYSVDAIMLERVRKNPEMLGDPKPMEIVHKYQLRDGSYVVVLKDQRKTAHKFIVASWDGRSTEWEYATYDLTYEEAKEHRDRRISDDDRGRNNPSRKHEWYTSFPLGKGPPHPSREGWYVESAFPTGKREHKLDAGSRKKAPSQPGKQGSVSKHKDGHWTAYFIDVNAYDLDPTGPSGEYTRHSTLAEAKRAIERQMQRKNPRRSARTRLLQGRGKYEVFYSDGGHGGPYRTLAAATKHADRYTGMYGGGFPHTSAYVVPQGDMLKPHPTSYAVYTSHGSQSPDGFASGDPYRKNPSMVRVFDMDYGGGVEVPADSYRWLSGVVYDKDGEPLRPKARRIRAKDVGPARKGGDPLLLKGTHEKKFLADAEAQRWIDEWRDDSERDWTDDLGRTNPSHALAKRKIKVRRRKRKSKALTPAARAALPTRDFARPEDRGYPIEDIEHAVSAVARVVQHHTRKNRAGIITSFDAEGNALMKNIAAAYPNQTKDWPTMRRWRVLSKRK